MAPFIVSDYMTKKVITINQSASAAEIAKIMAADAMDQGYVLVLREGKPVGIVTRKDLVNKILATGITRRTKVTQIMTKPLITVDPEDDLLKAAQIMSENTISKLVVMRDDIVYGIITEKDIALKCGSYIDSAIRDLIRWTVPLGL
jgi:signal-transduction protein with cAMP-binding, CBS, and nucleotidyltransferase domain